MSPDRSLGRRIVAVAALSAGLVMLVATVAAAMLLKVHIEQGFDSRLRQDARLLLAGLSHDNDGTLVIEALPDNAEYAQRLSGWYWLVREKDEVVARSRSLVTYELPRGMARSPHKVAGPRGEMLRVITIEQMPEGTSPALSVTVAGPQSGVDRVVLAEMMPLVGGLVALGLVLTGVLWWQVNRSLAPLNELVHDIERLRDGGIPALPPSGYVELSRLTTTINELLGQTRSLVIGYRDRAAKLAHALKTPLALIAARAGGHEQSPDRKVLDAVSAMQRQIDHNLKRARAVSGSSAFATRVPVAEVVSDLMFALGHSHAARGLSQSVSVAEGAVFVGDREDLEEMLGNLIENAHKWARSSVSVSATVCDGGLQIAVADDGPGLTGSEANGGSSGAEASHQAAEPTDPGLGLAITREIAAAYGGVLKLGRSETGGAMATLQFSSVSK
jgi:signal transduction histidine kinase